MNVQVFDVIVLIQRMFEGVVFQFCLNGVFVFQVIVIGYFFGGVLVQIILYYFNVKGEIFNVYGVVSFSYCILEGGNIMINYVMVFDLVSVVLLYFGQVCIYVRLNEISMFVVNGFSNYLLCVFIFDWLIIVVGSLFGVYKLGNFFGDGLVLQYLEMQQLVKDNVRMIEEYCDDVELLCCGVICVVCGILGGVIDLYDYIRGLLQFGELVCCEVEKNGYYISMLCMDDVNYVGNLLFNDVICGVYVQDVCVGCVLDVMSM